MSDAALDWLLALATFMVLFGVALEGVEHVEEIRRHGWQARSLWKTIPRLGFAILVIGLAVEWYSSTVLHDRDTGRIIGLQKAVAPRNIPQPDIKRIGMELRSLGRVRFDLTIPPALEPNSFLTWELLDTLRYAEWPIQSIQGEMQKIPLDPVSALFTIPLALYDGPLPPPRGTSVPSIPRVLVGEGVGVPGVRIYVDTINHPELMKPARALADALTGVGISAQAVSTFGTGGEAAPDVLHIVIGSHS